MDKTLLGKLIIRISVGFFILMIILNTLVLQMKVFPYFYSLPDGYSIEQMNYWMLTLCSCLRTHVLNSLLSLFIIHITKLLDSYLDRFNLKLGKQYHCSAPVRKISLEVISAGTLMLLNGSVNVWILTDTRTLSLF